MDTLRAKARVTTGVGRAACVRECFGPSRSRSPQKSCSHVFEAERQEVQTESRSVDRQTNSPEEDIPSPLGSNSEVLADGVVCAGMTNS